ncbi:kinase-like domain-containing protein [Mycena haematopus]|nr:kinase-like domain-containing protein [Mycena haematopus]
MVNFRTESKTSTSLQPKAVVPKARLTWGRWTYWRRESIMRVSRTLIIKSTRHTKLTEALNLDYVAANTTIPVPRVHEVFKDRRGRLYLLMDYMDGTELEKVWKNLQPVDRLAIVRQLCEFIDQLRRLEPPHPGAVEAVDGTACKDFRIRSDGFGPFNSVAEFETFLGRGWFIENKLAEYAEYSAEFSRCESRSYRTVFTHCDLAPRNILVKDNRIVAIVDWEMAGWYPEYWEYTQAFFSNFDYPEGFWDLFETEFLERYPDELIAERCVASVLERY